MLERERVRRVPRDQRRPTTASGSPRRISSISSSRSARSTVGWRGSSRAPGSGSRWSSCWPNCTAARSRWRARSAQGSRFTVWLPLRDGRQDASEPDAGRGAPAPPSPSRVARVGRAHRARRRRRPQVGGADPAAARGGRIHGAARGIGRGGAAARGAAAAVADHARHHAARTWTAGSSSRGIKQVPALRHVPVVIISIRRGPHQGLRARRRGGDAEAGLAAGAVRVARRARAVRRAPTGSRSRCWWSTTIPRRWSWSPSALAAIGERGAAGVRRRARRSSSRARELPGPDRARPDDAGGERLRRRGGAQRATPRRRGIPAS